MYTFTIEYFKEYIKVHRWPSFPHHIPNGNNGTGLHRFYRVSEKEGGTRWLGGRGAAAMFLDEIIKNRYLKILYNILQRVRVSKNLKKYMYIFFHNF